MSVTMNPIIQLLQENNIKETQINELFEALTSNPLMAMAKVQELGIPQDRLQALMAMVMTNPQLIKDAVEELGLDMGKVDAAKEQLKSQS
jgi:hypothetical protein